MNIIMWKARPCLHPGHARHRSMANHGAELYSAAYHGNTASIRKLISRGADLKWRHPQGGATALYVACEFGHAEAAQLLLDSGAPADAARDDGATPLYKACQDGGRTDIVLMLLAAGAQVDQMDQAGMTPLWVACHQGKPALVRALLDAKADPMRKVQGWGPLDLARSEGREEIAQTVATPASATPGAGGKGVGKDEEEKGRRPCYERVGGRKMRRGCFGMFGDFWECWGMFRDD